MDGNLAMLNYQQYNSEEEFNEAEREYHEDREFQRLAHTLISLVRNNQGIQIACPCMNEIVRDIFYSSGVLIRTKFVTDIHTAEIWNDWYGEYETVYRKRLNRREFTLTIDEP